LKILLPIESKEFKDTINDSLARAPYFVIYNTEDNSSYYISNYEAANSQGGAGIKAGQLILDSKVDALITPSCGQNAADLIKAGNVKIYQTRGKSVKVNVELLIDNNLSLLEEIHEGLHNHGGK